MFDGNYDRDYNDIRTKLTLMLMYGECLQGGDGNGIAVMQQDGETLMYKSPNQVGTEYKAIMDFMNVGLLRKSRYVQIHTRLATHGSSQNKENLHPFHYPHVVGSHNGVIYSYKQLWETYKADVGTAKGENDSEVIFAMLNAYAPTLDVKDVDTVLQDISGVLAIAAYSPTTPDRFIVVSRENPACYYVDEKNGMIWYASVPAILVDAGVCSHTNAVKLEHEMLSIDYKDRTWNTYELTQKTVKWAPRSYNYSTLDDDDWYFQPSTNNKVYDFKKDDVQKCPVCDGTGEIEERDFMQMFGYVDTDSRRWWDNGSEMVTSCDFCVAHDRKEVNYNA